MGKEKQNEHIQTLAVTTTSEVDSTNSTEVTSLRRVAEGIPTAAWFILINEFCERFAFYGVSTPFQNYIQNPPAKGPADPPGELGRGQSVATALQSFFTFFCFVTPLLGAVVADQYLGRYRTILVFSLIYIVGLLILTTTATPASLAAGGGFPGFIVSLLVIGLATGGIKGTVTPMCADQYREVKNRVRTLKSGEKVLVDYDLSIQRLYNWFYWAINVGSLLGGILCPLLELNVGFWAAYLLPTCMFAVAVAVFIAGRHRYYKAPPAGSIVVKVFRLITFARREANKPENKETRKQCGSFLDFAKTTDSAASLDAARATPSNVEGNARGWDNQFVEEVKRTIMTCKIFLPLSIYWVCYMQLNNNLLSQAAVLSRPPGLSNDIMNSFDPIALIIFIPIADFIVYPLMRKHNIRFMPQQRITTGFILAALSMIYAAVLQHYIYKDPLFIETQKESSLSVFLQIPCYFMIAFSEIFALITSLEYAYTHAPAEMKSVVSALSIWPACVASLISLAISPSAQDPNMVWVYAGIGITAFLTGGLYYALFRHYDLIDEEVRHNRQVSVEQPGQPIVIDDTLHEPKSLF